MKQNLHLSKNLLLILFSISSLGVWAQSTIDPDHACINSTEDYWVINTPGSTYNWVLSGGGTITSGQGSSAIKINWTSIGGPYVLTVTETFTSTTGCDGLPVSLNIIVDPLPTPFNVTGTGGYCLGGAGLPVGLSDSELGVNYQLQLDGVNSGALISGTGNAISFGNKTVAGTYTVVATSSLETACTINMTGNAIITINPLPVPTIAGLAAIETLVSTVYTTEAGMTGYVWTISAGGTITAGGTATDNTVTVIWNTAGPQTVSVNYENIKNIFRTRCLSGMLQHYCTASPNVYALHVQHSDSEPRICRQQRSFNDYSYQPLAMGRLQRRPENLERYHAYAARKRTCRTWIIGFE